MPLLPHPRILAVAALVSALTWLPACGQPPEKEIHEAQGALDAARAAGAQRYAPEDYAAAADALKKSQDAVSDRDYRQALNYALDCRERAQNAVKAAMNRKAAVRNDAERTIADATAALAVARASLQRAHAQHVPARLLADPGKAIDAADASLQKAREALNKHDELTALDQVSGLVGRLQSAAHDIDALARRRR
ncbi:MAG TPA: DUF4398 domain-containing protein [Vicinamibacterales bacterium]|nr:DUF4398 domain-containing protein [Vicinamibacterales bacterium]